MPDSPPIPKTRVSPTSGELEELERLVRRTEGSQPWRRVFHAFNGLVTAAALGLFHVPRATALTILGGISVMLVGVDWVRLRSARANRLFFQAFQPLASPREATGAASSSWYALGLLVTVGLFSRKAAISGILMLALADPAASWVGRRWGRRPFLGGSVEGTVVFLAVSVVLLLFLHPWPVAVGAALATTLSERLAWPLDDNFAVPVTGALVVTILGALR